MGRGLVVFVTALFGAKKLGIPTFACRVQRLLPMVNAWAMQFAELGHFLLTTLLLFLCGEWLWRRLGRGGNSKDFVWRDSRGR